MKKIAKAIVAAFTSIGTTAAAAAKDGYDSTEIIVGLCAAIVAFFLVWVTPNESG